MISKHKVYSIALVSAAMILMMMNITSAAPFAYITNYDDNNISVTDTATNKATATVDIGNGPYGIAVPPDGKKFTWRVINATEYL